MLYEVDERAIKEDENIQCQFCGRISANPLFEETENMKRARSYIG